MAKEDVTETHNVRLPLDVVSELFSNRRRRLAFAVVRQRSGAMSASALATEVATLEHDELQAAVPEHVHRRTLLSLVHCHLPKLDEAGAVEFDATELSVVGTDRVIGSVPSETDPEPTGDSTELPIHERERIVLSILDDRGDSMPESEISLSELAGRVAARARDVGIEALDDEVCHRVEVSLHHTHLPKLTDADLITYDAEHRTVGLAE